MKRITLQINFQNLVIVRTHTEPSPSNTGHLKDIASSSSGMISELVDLTDLSEAFPSFSLIGLSEEREQLTKEIDLAYQESLKAHKLKP